jgi:glycolate oxidase FAD binding subunit
MTGLELSELNGMLEYNPSEFTFTALAGTPLTKVAMVLNHHGQVLPFDPLLTRRGATLGGTVAAGTAGPGRYHYGGIRDFLIGVLYVDSGGRLVRGGGSVVKNAAGFDLPKLMVGSLGALGVFIELTFKVFPRPDGYASVCIRESRLEAALELICSASASPIELDALELVPDEPDWQVWLRLSGLRSVMPARIDALRNLVGGEVVEPETAEAFWGAARELDWLPEGWSLVKVPLTPKHILRLESAIIDQLEISKVRRRYSVAGQVAWLAVDSSLDAIDRLLTGLELPGLLICGSAEKVRLGVHPGLPFERLVKNALDPLSRFRDL